ncbi:MAG: M4 family metallopeptidase, partial [Luteimonas sp.]
MPLSPKLLPFAIILAMGGNAAAAVGTSPAAGRALNLIKTNMTATRTTASDGFVARDVIVDASGAEHVRFDRTYNGLPVLGGDLVVHSQGTSFSSASLTLGSPINLSISPKLTASDAITRAGAQFGTGFKSVPTARLVVYARNTPRLAYEAVFVGSRADQTPTHMHYIVDALTGAVLAKWEAVKTGTLPGSGTGTLTPAVGSGRSLLSGTVTLNTAFNSQKLYELKDLTRGGAFTMDWGNTFRDETATKVLDGNNVWGNFTRSDRATTAVDAHYGVATTWDYYKNTFGRRGIRNDGVGAMAVVHYLRNYSNAFWSDDCFCMVFGDGDGVTINPLVALDVAGHEMSHGVMAATANLDYFGASGGLNEANSDIMGAMVEFYANNSQNPPNYLIGEKLFIDNPAPMQALRSMFKPSMDGISPDCYPNKDPDPNGYEYFFNNYLDVHFSSGVANHFYYLLAEGAVAPAGYGLTAKDVVCNGNTAIVGIGRSAAQQIWYRAV